MHLDLLELDGQDLRRLSVEQRKLALAKCAARAPCAAPALTPPPLCAATPLLNVVLTTPAFAINGERSVLAF
jgi:hypothetical protein